MYMMYHIVWPGRGLHRHAVERAVWGGQLRGAEGSAEPGPAHNSPP